MSGSIFMDYMNQKDFSDFNTIIYGHHMDGGAMFGDFDRYLDPSFADSHLYGNVLPMEKIMDWSYLHSWSWMLIIQVFM